VTNTPISASENLALHIADELQSAYELRSSDLKKSIELTENLLKICGDKQLEELQMAAKTNLGLFYLIQGRFDAALAFSNDALSYFEERQNQKGIADSKYNIGSIYYRTNNYHQALLLLLDSLHIYRHLGDHYNQARTLKSMGTVYELFADYDKAVESYEKSIEAAHAIDDEALESNALNPLSAIYFKQGKQNLALETIERSVTLKIKTNDQRGLAFALYGRGKIYSKLGNQPRAIVDLEETQRLLQIAGDQMGVGMANNKLGVAYMALGDFGRARNYFNNALEISGPINFQVVRYRVFHNLYLLAKQEGDAAIALEYLEKYMQCKDAVIDKETYNLIKSYDAVSQIERLEQEAKRQQERNEIIERKNAELDSFFYRVSHDIKGPISSLMGLSSLVAREITHPESLKLFNMYHSQILRVNDIVMGLIKLTRISNQQEGLTIIDFDKLTTDCIDSCRYLPQSKTIRFIREISPIVFKSEWAIVNTILQNLIENAIKYYRPRADSFVRIHVRMELDDVVIIVEDNGQGIPESHRQNIFDMFFRATDRMQGSGLGLYILKRAVERLNGGIEVVSTPGAGSTFTVRLPAIPASTNVR
jgi:hypothetical protein